VHTLLGATLDHHLQYPPRERALPSLTNAGRQSARLSPTRALGRSGTQRNKCWLKRSCGYSGREVNAGGLAY
jgi:hypothetical protein